MKQVNIPIQLLGIDDDGFHLQIKILINGKPANVLIDTGASRTVLDKNRIKRFESQTKASPHNRLSSGLGTNTMKSHRINIKEVRLGTLLIKNYKAILLDLSHVNESYKQIGLKAIDGVIGGDILRKYKAGILYEKKVLVLKG